MSYAEQVVVKSLIRTIRASLDELEALLPQAVDEDPLIRLDPKSPRNKSDQWLTERGIEVCYRLFDLGKNRYEVAKLMGLSFGAATHRQKLWEALGGANREKQPLED